MKKIAFVIASCAFALVAGAAPELADYTVEQNADRMVIVSFILTEKAILTMDVFTNGVSIGAENYQTFRDAMTNVDEFPANKAVAAGPHVFTWRPTKEWPGYHFANGEFSVAVKAWSFDAPPDYMVIDGSSVSNTPSFYAKADDIPGGIKTADPDDADAVSALSSDPYRTTRLVLRKIPAAGVKWAMGSPENEAYRQSNETQHYVTLTNDYYVSIYPMTFTQCRLFMNRQDNDSVHPKHNMAYTTLRGSYNTEGYCWPGNGHAVTSASALGYMRWRTGFEFDLLTEAEWEYACRAGTSGSWSNDGTKDNLSEIAWLGYTGGAKSHVVGLKKPNAWGLYDTHGLVQEWCLDQYAPYAGVAEIAPEGTTTNVTTRVLRGGPKGVRVNNSYGNSNYISTRSAYRTADTGTKTNDGNTNGYGVRVCIQASMPGWMRER